MSIETEEQISETADAEPDAYAERMPDEPRNLTVLALQSVVLRTGWIFKTESVIMPAFMDAISGSGWMRGCLPILSRIGQSMPPMIFADRLRGMELKKRALILTSLGMALPFLLLSTIWVSLESRQQVWLPPLFLLLYFLFFCATGLNQLVYSTLEGKLIRPFRRGRLIGLSGIGGSILAVAAALLWLRPWLAMPDNAGFTYVFLFNGVMFLIAGLVSMFCVEPADPAEKRPLRIREPFVDAWRIYRSDRSFRRAARVAMLFLSSLLVFPHYQWLGRERIGTTNEDLIIWVIAQNISFGLYSPLIGAAADRWGFRVTIRVALFLSALTPLTAILFAEGIFPGGREWYWLTFAMLGLTPVTMRAIFSYTLELAEPPDHPRYLSTMRVCYAVPFVFAPLVGWLMDLLPFAVPFGMVSGLVFLAGVLTFWMAEPRHSISSLR
jgi:MFS family permease